MGLTNAQVFILPVFTQSQTFLSCQIDFYKNRQKSPLISTFIQTYSFIRFPENFPPVQVNLCQKLLFLHQLTHNMMTDSSLNYKFNKWKFQAQNMGRTCCVQKLFWMPKTIAVHNMFSTCLRLELSCIELAIQWTICHHIVG